jgi:hypothetical protein
MLQLDGNVALPEVMQLAIVKARADNDGGNMMLRAKPHRLMNAERFNNGVATLTQIAANGVRRTVRVMGIVGQIDERKQLHISSNTDFWLTTVSFQSCATQVESTLKQH